MAPNSILLVASLFVSRFQISDQLCCDMAYLPSTARPKPLIRLRAMSAVPQNKDLFTEQLNSCGKDVSCCESSGMETGVSLGTQY